MSSFFIFTETFSSINQEDQNVVIVAVGIGSQANRDQLKEFAEHVFMIEEFEQLKTMIYPIGQILCPGKLSWFPSPSGVIKNSGNMIFLVL